MKRWLLYSVKIALALGILIFLFWRTFESNPEVYSQLRNESKDWLRLVLACLILLACSLLTFVRWYLLVRVLGLSFPFGMPSSLDLSVISLTFFLWGWSAVIFLRRLFWQKHMRDIALRPCSVSSWIVASDSIRYCY